MIAPVRASAFADEEVLAAYHSEADKVCPSGGSITDMFSFSTMPNHATPTAWEFSIPVITEITGFRTPLRHSACSSCRLQSSGHQ